MEPVPVPMIAFAERSANGVMIAFVDGRCALYSAALLDQMFFHAIEAEQRNQRTFPIDTNRQGTRDEAVD